MCFSHHQFVLCKQRLRMGSTVVNGLFLQLLMILILLTSTSDSQLTESVKNQIDTGIRLGREIATVFENRNFPEVLKKVAANIGPYLGAFGPALSLILSFIPTKSAELEYMEKLKMHLDIRFDKLDVRFDEIERKIDWAVVKVNFGQIEQNIRVMSDELADLFEVPKEGLNNRKILFVNSYENNYEISGTKLYNSVVDNQGTFQENLGQSVMRYTKNDRAKTNVFLQGILQLVMEAVKIELTYLQIKGFKVNAELERRQWINKIGVLLNKFKEIDYSVKSAFQSQCLEDTRDIVTKNAHLSNRELSNTLYNVLTGKYDWRDWMVLVYNPVWGWEYHCISHCGGGHFFRLHGHNVVIASVDKSEPSLDILRAYRTLADHNYGNNEADDVCNSMDTSFVCSKAVIKHRKRGFWGNSWDPSELHANFKHSRAVLVKKSHFTMILFQ